MKKKIIMAIVTIAGAAILGLGIYHSEASQSESGLSKEEIEEKVTAQYPGDITSINLEKQANQSVYMVDIKDALRAYTIILDSHTGEVMELKETSDPDQVKIAEKKEKEEQADKKNKNEAKKSKTKETTDDSESQKQNRKNNESKSAEKKDTVISVDEAIKIAQEQFSGEVDEVELEKEDGRLIYEVEIENGDDEAEIEIDAYTGEVLVVSIERDD